MKRFIISVFLLSVLVVSFAKSVGEMFISMPDSMIPYVSKEQRQDLVNMKNIDPGTDATLTTMFKSNVVLKYLSEERMTFEVGTLCYEIGRLYSNILGDSVYCMLNTLQTPEKETLAHIYNKEWKKISDLSFDSLVNMEKPDTMQSELYLEALSLIEYPVVEAYFDDGPSAICLKCNFPMVNESEKKKLEAFVLQRKLKWNGESFK